MVEPRGPAEDGHFFRPAEAGLEGAKAKGQRIDFSTRPAALVEMTI